MSGSDTAVEQLESLIAECERHGANVDRQQARSEFDRHCSEACFTTANALWIVQDKISRRHNLPESIVFGPVTAAAEPTPDPISPPEDLVPSLPDAVADQLA